MILPPTTQEVLDAMSGYSKVLAWSEFNTVPASPNPPMMALTSSGYTRSGVKFVQERDQTEYYKLKGLRVTVQFNRRSSWKVAAVAQLSADEKALLLQHEQGHFDITKIVARNLCFKLLQLDCDTTIFGDPARYLNAQIRDLDAKAKAQLAFLQSDPKTGADGFYDTATNHSQNVPKQQLWNKMLKYAWDNNTDLMTTLWVFSETTMRTDLMF
jgi:hypothetical protein